MEKKKYMTPAIELVELDNGMSLQLESNPPIGPDEGASLSPEFLQTNPYKTRLG